MVFQLGGIGEGITNYQKYMEDGGNKNGLQSRHLQSPFNMFFMQKSFHIQDGCILQQDNILINCFWMKDILPTTKASLMSSFFNLFTWTSIS